MRILRLVLVFGIASCHGSAAPARVVDATAVTPAALRPSAALCKAPAAGTPALGLPAIAPSDALHLDVDRPGGVAPADGTGKLTVDGVVTSSMWPMQPPSQWKLPDGRTLLYDGFNMGLMMLWEPRSKTLTELGRGALTPVPGLGMLLSTSAGDRGQVGIISDIDPAVPRLRELWRFERATRDVVPVGVIDGMPAMIVRPPVRFARSCASSFAGFEPSGCTAAAAAATPTPVTFLCLGGAGVTGQFDAVMPAGFHAIGVDPVDGHRLLLLGDADTQCASGTCGRLPGPQPCGYGGASFDADVAVLDLVTGKVRALGRAVGGCTELTNVPHPVLHVGWSAGATDTSSAPPPYAPPDAGTTLVDPETETLIVTWR